jgi:hypothetical protein
VALVALALDVAIVALFCLVVWVGATGGGAFEILGTRVTARDTGNPLLFITIAAGARYALRRAAPFLGIPRLSLREIDLRAREACHSIDRRLALMSGSAASRLVVALVVTAIAIKAAFAWNDPGFYSGDDVEVQEMSLKALFGADWPVWDLRNATFPLGVVYPAQRLALATGVTGIPALVFAGRLMVAILSSVAIWIVWRAGRRMWPEAPGFALAAAFLLWTCSVHMAFGSSELPRPVATLFVLGGFVALQSPARGSAIVSGGLLGVAACFRFSEIVFLVPAVAQLLLARRLAAAAVLGAAALTAAALVLGLTDLWYWGSPFHSVWAVVDFTLVKRLSSRGYESPLWYVLQCPRWISPVLLVAAAWAFVRRRRTAEGLWIWLPLLVLSCLPHKEARYAIPIVPFVCLAAVRGLRDACEASVQRRWLAPALCAAFAIGFIYDVSHWRLPRTNGDVRLATWMAGAVPGGAPVAVEQAWRMGGRLYFPTRTVIDLDPQLVGEVDYLWSRVPNGAWVAIDARTRNVGLVEQQLASRGYMAVMRSADSPYRVWRPPHGVR